MSTGDAIGAALLLLALVIFAVATWWLLRRRPRAAPYGANPNPARITDAMWWLWQQLAALEPGSQLGGIYANKPGYHNTFNDNDPWDYSVIDNPPDHGGPADKAAAIDWTFPEAQSGDYRRISLYTQRLWDSALDLSDPRLNGWREFYGNLDDGGAVDGYDMRYAVAVTSDSSHYWHIHLSENRDQTTSYDNKEALLSVLRGETVDRWRAGTIGDGTVILNCPTDPDRLDLFYVGADGQVWHRWYMSGGMAALWAGSGAGENLGGRIIVGTLSASWTPDGSAINIVGLGDVDETPAPSGCGQYWGYELGRTGARSGWGSLTNVYGQRP